MEKDKKSYEERINIAAQLIAQSSYLVCFTGAGISTESGVPDFRGPDGLWTRRDKGLPPPKQKKPWSETEPNEGHLAIVELQNLGIMKFLISQNIDNLHIKSGIQEDLIAEFHGNMTKMRCLDCGIRYNIKELDGSKKCPQCNGKLRTDVVNFGDSIPIGALKSSMLHSRQSDVFLVVGSTLTVTPAANMPIYALENDAKLIILNNQRTGFDGSATVKFTENAGPILTAIVEKVKVLKGK
ncbi:MAG: Sir2 family NAD-dependent protein deacetylase [Promethearchaeota archaeon]